MIQLRDTVGISEPESLATLAFILTPRFTILQSLTAGRKSSCMTSTWTAQTAYDLLLKILQVAEALISEDHQAQPLQRNFLRLGPPSC